MHFIQIIVSGILYFISNFFVGQALKNINGTCKRSMHFEIKLLINTTIRILILNKGILDIQMTGAETGTRDKLKMWRKNLKAREKSNGPSSTEAPRSEI